MPEFKFTLAMFRSRLAQALAILLIAGLTAGGIWILNRRNAQTANPLGVEIGCPVPDEYCRTAKVLAGGEQCLGFELPEDTSLLAMFAGEAGRTSVGVRVQNRDRGIVADYKTKGVVAFEAGVEYQPVAAGDIVGTSGAAFTVFGNTGEYGLRVCFQFWDQEVSDLHDVLDWLP